MPLRDNELASLQSPVAGAPIAADQPIPPPPAQPPQAAAPTRPPLTLPSSQISAVPKVAPQEEALSPKATGLLSQLHPGAAPTAVAPTPSMPSVAQTPTPPRGALQIPSARAARDADNSVKVLGVVLGFFLCGILFLALVAYLALRKQRRLD